MVADVPRQVSLHRFPGSNVLSYYVIIIFIYNYAARESVNFYLCKLDFVCKSTKILHTKRKDTYICTQKKTTQHIIFVSSRLHYFYFT